jgi:hypothetical protein
MKGKKDGREEGWKGGRARYVLLANFADHFNIHLTCK